MDDKDIDTIDISSIGSIDLDSIMSNSVTINTGAFGSGASGTAGSFLTSSGANGSTWANTTINYTSPTYYSIGSTGQQGLYVDGTAQFEGDVKIKGRSLEKLLTTIESRLAILEDPTPEKLEKFAALKKAYEHYKTLERLIGDDDKESTDS